MYAQEKHIEPAAIWADEALHKPPREMPRGRVGGGGPLMVESSTALGALTLKTLGALTLKRGAPLRDLRPRPRSHLHSHFHSHSRFCPRPRPQLSLPLLARCFFTLSLLSLGGWGCEEGASTSSAGGQAGRGRDLQAPARDAMGGAPAVRDRGVTRDQAAEQDRAGQDRAGQDRAFSPTACGEGPPCPEGYACECGLANACECVAPMDRSGCEEALRCRAGEECRAIPEDPSGRALCWLPPESLAPQAARSSEPGTQLFVGARSMSITPDGFETPLPGGLDGVRLNFFPPLDGAEGLWRDCGYDNLCPGDEGYPGPDPGELDGELQGAFIAGFSHGRPAQRCPAALIGCAAPECCHSALAHDDLKAQIVVLRRGALTVGLASLDVVGIFHTDIEMIRRELSAELEARPELGAVDHLLIAATHNHEGPDSVGQYGAGSDLPIRSGRDLRWMARLRAQVVRGVIESLEALRPARAERALIKQGIEGLGMSDSRTPYIFDDNLPVLRLSDPRSGEVIATLLSVANHAEFLWDQNPYLSADYFHFLRRHLAEGLPEVAAREARPGKPALPGWGGVTLTFAGAIGGLINPGRGTAISYSGEAISEKGFAMADAAGQQLAARILEGYRAGQFSEVGAHNARGVSVAPLGYAAQRFLTPIDNRDFLLAGFVLRIIRRDIYNTQHRGGINFSPANPLVMSEVSVIRLGSLSLFTAPGEPFPELLTGGYPGRPSVQDPVIGDVEERLVDAVCDERGLPAGREGSPGGQSPCVVRADHENPPPWADAPEPPYGYELLPGTPFLIGLGGDFLGYLVPPYDFQIGARAGDHYEETNSAGPALVPDWLTALKAATDALAALE